MKNSKSISGKASVLVLTVAVFAAFLLLGKSYSAVKAANTVPAHHFIGNDNHCENGNVNENAIGNGQWFAGYCPTTSPSATPTTSPSASPTATPLSCGPSFHIENGQCVKNGDGEGNCGQNQGNGNNGKDNGFGNGEDKCETASPSPTATPTPEPCENEYENGIDNDGDNDACQPESTPTPDPSTSPEPTATPGDVCWNIEGFQGSIPDGYHKDTPDGACNQFQLGGAPQGGNGTGGQVLGASTGTGGQVLGASTMAGTGSFTEDFYMAIMGLGAIITAAGFKNFKKFS